MQLERAAKDIKGLEEQNTRILSDKKKIEKELFELQKEAGNWETVKKSEIRARTATKKLSEMLEVTALENETKEQELLKKNQGLEQQNLNQAKRIQECIVEINQLKEQYGVKNTDFINGITKINSVTEENARVWANNEEIIYLV